MPLDAAADTPIRDALDVALAPIDEQLAAGEDVAMNKPGEGWWLLDGVWRRFEAPEMTNARLRGIATLAIAPKRPADRQAIVSTHIPRGHRLEALTEPATEPGTTALCFRRSEETVSPIEEVNTRFNTERWNQWRTRKERLRATSEELLASYRSGDLEGFLRLCARRRRTPLICAPTGAGKTYLNKTYMQLLDEDARVLMLEDAKEAVLRQPNHLRLFFQKFGISPTALLQAALRLRPTFVAVQELRDPEVAYLYLNEGMAGHPGSPTTIHGRTPGEAARRLVNMILSSPAGKNMKVDTLIDMLTTAVDVIIPIENDRGARSIREVWFADEAAEHGETFADLLKD